MLLTALAFFSLAAILGMILISFVLRNKETPKAVAFIHGPLGAIGIILLIVYAFYHSPSPIESIVLFVLAAFMGFILIFRDLTGRSIPKWLAVLHGLTAITGFLFLLFFIFQASSAPVLT